jgi:hypothetical protein
MKLYPGFEQKNFDRKNKCKACKMERLPDGCDPCIGKLPGVVSACCGHREYAGYITFENGVTIVIQMLAMTEMGSDIIEKAREQNKTRTR